MILNSECLSKPLSFYIVSLWSSVDVVLYILQVIMVFFPQIPLKISQLKSFKRLVQYVPYRQCLQSLVPLCLAENKT